PDTHILCVVGSRQCSDYGKRAAERLISSLRGRDVAILSGLAYGIDAVAHRTALEAGLKTIAVPGSGLNPSVIYPSAHRVIAEKIVEAGGALLSEYEPDFKATPWSFPQRNRIMAGLSRSVLIVEASEKSGSLITARLAMDYNRDVYAVPGHIFSKTAAGTNKLIKDGATPVISAEEFLIDLGFAPDEKIDEKLDLSPAESIIYEMLAEPLSRDDLADRAKIPIAELNILLSSLELKGSVAEYSGKIARV
ncbi:DNA-processing protein DprA, partial [bacterium]|nr:DNA-processing protein DprA [bacterium]